MNHQFLFKNNDFLELDEKIAQCVRISSEKKFLSDRACVRCGATYDVHMEDSRTCYHYEGDVYSEDNPNKPIPLCRDCATEHHDYWDAMWDEYYRSRI